MLRMLRWPARIGPLDSSSSKLLRAILSRSGTAKWRGDLDRTWGHRRLGIGRRDQKDDL